MPLLHPRILLPLITASLSLLAAAPAFAQTPMRPFGARGSVVIGDLVGVRSGGVGFLGVLGQAAGSFGPVAPPSISGLVGYAHDDVEVFNPGGKVTTRVNVISVAPSLDGFITDRLSLGLATGFAHAWGSQSFPFAGGAVVERGSAYTFGIAPRVGYVFPLSGAFSLWPRAGVGFTLSLADTADAIPGSPARQSSLAGGLRWSGGVDLGVVFRPVRNLFFSATPELSLSYAATGQEVEGSTVYRRQGVLFRFAGTLGLGVLLGS